jgi:hypothetical protein
MVRQPRLEFWALGLLALAVGGWSWFLASGTRGLAALGGGAALGRSAEPSLPRIALERLKRAEGDAGAEAVPARDVFRFGHREAEAEPRPVSVTAAPVLPVDAGPATPPPPPTLPPFGVKYIGTLEQRGTRIAVLLSDDKKEVLTGREGDTVANRIRIVRIGFESVEVQDVGSDRIRRIPLKGN